MRQHRPNVHPGVILQEDFLQPRNLSQYRLAKDIQVPPRRINEIVLGKRSITPDTALRLNAYFGTSERFWLNLQLRYDLETAKQALDVTETASNKRVHSSGLEIADIETQMPAEANKVGGENMRTLLKQLASKIPAPDRQSETAPRERGRLFRRYLREEFWPSLPAEVQGQRLTKAEKEEILGYGPHGV